MAVSYVGRTTGSSVTTANPFVTTLPVNWQPGDVAVLVVHISATNLNATRPDGWTTPTGVTNPVDQDGSSRAYVWRRVLQAGDTPPTVALSGAVTGGWTIGVFRGGDQAAPTGQVGTGGAVGTSMPLPTLAAVEAGSAVWAAVHARVASGTLPSGITWNTPWTEVSDISTERATTAANLRNSAGYLLAATAGSYGGQTVSVANAVSSSLLAVLVEIRQASTPAEVTLTPAELALTAVAVQPQPLPVTVDLVSAVLTLTAVAVAVQPLPVTVTVAPAAMTLTAVAVLPQPLPVTVALTAAAFTLAAVAVQPQPLPVTVALSPAVLTLTALPVVPQPLPVTVTVLPATLTFTAVPVDAEPTFLPSAVTLTAATLTFTAVPVQPVPRAVNRTLVPAVLTLTALPVQPQPLPVTVVLTPAPVTFTAVAVQPTPLPVTVTLTAALLTLTAVPVDAQAAPITVNLMPAVLNLLAVAVVATMRPIPAAHSVRVHQPPARVTWSSVPASARRTL
ncbi:hypothetical protein ABZY58_11750 [Micromonospora tulbaghiae]|uniref:hypothetical protein n=1 Tax=Micromonospora tulbaghiae TaxID=479978 RepID=UPI0033B26494